MVLGVVRVGVEKMQDEYNHPDHAEMEWYEVEGWDKEIEAWRCTRCHVMAEPEDADSVFDEHDCDRYANLREKVTGAI